MPDINNIVKQLKNRKVFRSLAIYAGFAFVLIQVCSIVFPALYLPEWTMTFLVVLLIIGFPTTLVLSWIYDITPTEEGETPTAEATQPLGVYALTGLVLTVIGIGFWVAVGVFGVSFGGDDEVPSIAIIPFDNKGAEEDEFYAYGISSELISEVTSAGLIRVAGLKDIEKLEYQTLNYSELSEKLFVRYIAQGTLWKVDSVFQLSMELYDTKTSKVLWSESSQKAWNELSLIKGSLAENILKTLKVSTKQDITRAPSSNIEAYEYYLKSKYYYNTYIKLADIQSLDIARGLLKKAIELDNNLLAPKILLGRTYYFEKGDSEEHFHKVLTIARGLFEKALIKAEELDDKFWIGRSLRNIGNTYYSFEDEDKAYDYYIRSLKINEEIGDLDGMAHSLNNIGTCFRDKGDLDKALNYLIRTLEIREELGDEASILHTQSGLGHTYRIKGNYDKALESYTVALEISKEIENKVGMGWAINSIGIIYLDKGNYEKAADYLEKSVKINNEIGGYHIALWSKVHLNLLYKNLGKTYLKQDIIQLIKGAQDTEYLINFPLYQLLEDTSYLEIAYNQIQEKADAMEDYLKVKFLSYPIPSAIVEEWEKVK